MPDIPFSDFGVLWFEQIVGLVSDWFAEEIEAGYRTITTGLFNTPLPEGTGTEIVFGTPASGDEPWHSIYQSVVTGEIMLLALLVLFLTVQGRHFIRIFNVGSAYEDRRVRRKAWVGGVLIVVWYWVAVLGLYFVRGMTVALIPDVSRVGAALIDMLPAAAGNPMLTLILASLGGLAMVLLKAVYFLREVLLYVYVFGMPIGIALTYGNIPVLSRIAKRLCLQFIPLAILPLPAVLLFRGYALLFAGGDLLVTPGDAFLNYFTVVSLPLLALYVTWKTFRYASPLVSGAVERASRSAVTIGAVAGVGAAAGPRAAATAARFGPKAGASQAAVSRATSDDQRGQPTGGTSQDNVATDADGGLPQYRRGENDAGYYT
ncbi:hypothetical protein [Halorarius halobius]|uniref:hypothetical protein n=1 Tax=Halorarius halobius TaxID=2962671 RepID=UPI0020CF9521|nr:hypothetical protein [Halorarius halobius]